MYDPNGRMLNSVEMTDTNETKLNVSEFPQGVYLLKLTHNAEPLVNRFVVNH